MKPWPFSRVIPWVGLWAKTGTAMAKQSRIARKGLVKDIAERTSRIYYGGKRVPAAWGAEVSSLPPYAKTGTAVRKIWRHHIEGRRTDGGISPDNLSCLAAARALDRVEKVLLPFEFFSPCEDFSASSASPALPQWAGASAVSSSLPVLVLALSLSPWLRASALKSFLRRLVAAPPLCITSLQILLPLRRFSLRLQSGGVC